MSLLVILDINKGLILVVKCIVMGLFKLLVILGI